jgi:O-antigen ligase
VAPSTWRRSSSIAPTTVRLDPPATGDKPKPARWRPHRTASDPSGAGATRTPTSASTLPPALPGSGFAFWSLWAFTLVLFVAPQNYLPIPSPAKLAFGLAVASHLASQAMGGVLTWRVSRPVAIASALLGWAIVTTPFSLWPGGSAQIILDQFLKSLAAFWLLGSVIDRPRRLHVLLWSLCFMSLPIALHAVTAFGTATDRIGGYSSGVASNPNDLALVLDILLPIAAALAAGSRRLGARLILLGIVVLNAVAIVLTFSRAGFLALLWSIVLMVRAFLPRGRRTLVLASVVLIGLGVVFAMPTYQARLATIWYVDTDPTGSGQVRSQGNINALRFIEEHPIVGAGIGQDVLAMNDYRRLWVSVHNVYLQHAVDLGLPGLALFIWLFVACLRTLGDGQRILATVPASDELSYAADGIRISLLVFAVAAFFGPVAYNYYFYYTAGLALAVEHVALALTGGRLPPPPEPTRKAPLQKARSWAPRRPSSWRRQPRGRA